MSSNFLLRSFRILLLPFSLVYWLVIAIRNWMYNKNILHSTSFALPLICVGNLSVGGTGKSPMVEYLVRLLKGNYKIATLSRGYKRRTRGYALANEKSTALEIGDEPMQFYSKFPDVPVAVGEERLIAIPQLLHDRPETEVILLDDAFQHRTISAGLNILLTDFSNLFTRDFYLPTGDLRDLKSEYKRAHIIVVTKCPPGLSPAEKEDLILEIDPAENQSVFFSAIEYGQPYHLLTGAGFSFTEHTEVLLVTGIANPKPLQSMLEKYSKSYHLLQYPDHRIFTIDDLKEIKKKFSALDTVDKIILTTEKDAVRLIKFNSEIANWPIYVLPVRHHFLYEEGRRFDEAVINFIRQFGQSRKN